MGEVLSESEAEGVCCPIEKLIANWHDRAPSDTFGATSPASGGGNISRPPRGFYTDIFLTP